MRRFDKKRPGRKTSNEEWVNPHDPDAKVGKTKDGATDMIYRPEHVSDLESGAIVEAEVREGDQADTKDLSERVMVAIHTLEEVCTDTPKEKLGKELASDEGYFSMKEIGILQEAGIRTVIADPHGGKRRKDLPREERAILNRATRVTTSKSGKALLRRRGEFLERGFCHVLDHGGMRKASLRDRANLSKRYVAAAFSFNLSLLLRTLSRIGTPKQWLASGKKAKEAFLDRFLPRLELLFRLYAPRFPHWCTLLHSACTLSGQNLGLTPTSGNRSISTGCYSPFPSQVSSLVISGCSDCQKPLDNSLTEVTRWRVEKNGGDLAWRI